MQHQAVETEKDIYIVEGLKQHYYDVFLSNFCSAWR